MTTRVFCPGCGQSTHVWQGEPAPEGWVTQAPPDGRPGPTIYWTANCLEEFADRI